MAPRVDDINIFTYLFMNNSKLDAMKNSYEGNEQ